MNVADFKYLRSFIIIFRQVELQASKVPLSIKYTINGNKKIEYNGDVTMINFSRRHKILEESISDHRHQTLSMDKIHALGFYVEASMSLLVQKI